MQNIILKRRRKKSSSSLRRHFAKPDLGACYGALSFPRVPLAQTGYQGENLLLSPSLE